MYLWWRIIFLLGKYALDFEFFLNMIYLLQILPFSDSYTFFLSPLRSSGSWVSLQFFIDASYSLSCLLLSEALDNLCLQGFMSYLYIFNEVRDVFLKNREPEFRSLINLKPNASTTSLFLLEVPEVFNLSVVFRNLKV